MPRSLRFDFTLIVFQSKEKGTDPTRHSKVFSSLLHAKYALFQTKGP